MDGELSRRSHEVFSRALDVAERDRSGFIETQCAGDARLRSAVDRLIRAIEDSATFLEVPALSGGTRPPADAGPRRSVIGGYRVVRIIGVGGMATVYEAVKDHPTRRVALKVMRQGLSRSSALARFRFETEVLARLHHPGIAQMFEVGAADEGDGLHTPFFAMELIEGALPITAHAARHGLSRAARLEMFAHICDAVHHGHQIGIIHRDLKPGNILVGSDGRPKVIDFGVARSTDPGHTRITHQADLGQLLGTLNSMSPEQCTGDAAGLDIRTDVYSLGVVLYELLCATLPHDVASLPITEALRVVQHESPKRPSTIDPSVRGDLEAIILKAIEKERERRYPTASELAADIRRYLADQPVMARPATALYQLRKFARRNRPLVAGVGAVVFTLIAGIAATSWMAYVATAARRDADQRAAELERVAAFQESQLADIDVPAMGDRLRAALTENAAVALARASTDEATAGHDAAELERLIAGVNFTTLALRTLDENVLQRSRAAIDARFADQPILRARLLQTLAGTMNILGLPEQSEPVLAEALRIRTAELGPEHPDTLHSVHSMGALLRELGRYDESVDHLRMAHAGRSSVLGADHADTLNSANSLGVVLRLRGDVAETERIWTDTLAARRRTRGDDHADTLDSLNNMGILFATQGRLAEAEVYWRELLERRRRVFGPDHPQTIGAMSNFGALLHDQGKLMEARSVIEEALGARRRLLGDTHPSTLLTIGNLASLLQAMGALEEAEVLARECVTGRTEVLGPENPNTVYSTTVLAGILSDKGDHAGAETILRAALEVQHRVLPEGHIDTLRSMADLGAVVRAAGRLEEAASIGAACVDRARASTSATHWRMGTFLVELGRTLTAMGRWDEAGAALDEARSILVAARGAADPYTVSADAALAALATARSDSGAATGSAGRGEPASAP